MSSRNLYGVSNFSKPFFFATKGAGKPFFFATKEAGKPFFFATKEAGKYLLRRYNGSKKLVDQPQKDFFYCSKNEQLFLSYANIFVVIQHFIRIIIC